MNDAHERFQAWLTAGAEGDPPRDVAVHASVCAVCSESIAALDLLAVVDPERAAMPAVPTGAERGRAALAGRLLGATAFLHAAIMLGLGVSLLIGVSRPVGPVAQASRSPEQSVLAGTATPEPTPEPTPSPSQETLSPLVTPAPTQRPPVATPVPYVPPPPTPIPTAVPTLSPSPSPSEPPSSPSSSPSEPPSSPADSDLDGVSDADETLYGSDPNNILSTPESGDYAASTCMDAVDNDLDTFTDGADPGCP